MSFLDSTSHRRFNPLTGQWVLVSPHRTQRPWQGLNEKPAAKAPPIYDPDCYLCPGNARAGGARNPPYERVFVFDNDYAALQGDARGEALNRSGLIVAQPEPGLCRVICFTPRHDLRLARMSAAEIAGVVDVWAEQTAELSAIDWVGAVQIFENQGAMMGASNPHPHCQAWATHHVPNEIASELANQQRHARDKGSCLLCDYLALERGGERIVFENQHFVALVPFWAVWPFETMLLPRRHLGTTGALASAERMALAEALRALTIRYDNLFESPMPYSMGLHQPPTDGAAHESWHFHIHFYPPLLRSATVRKFMVGFEMLASPQRDITPESAARRLRDLPEFHYAERD